MTKQNQRLALVLAGLILVYALTIVFHAAGRESNIQATTFHNDTAGITEIDLYPHKMRGQEIKLLHEAGTWRVRSGSVEAMPAANSPQELLNSLATVPAQRLVSRSKDRWNEYGVGDTSGTRVVLLKGTDPVGDYYIGGPAGASMYGGGAAYIRPNGHNEVYAIDGYLNGMVDKTLADWRDKTFLRFAPGDITSVSFQGTDHVVVSRKDSVWRLNGTRLSTDSVRRYLGRLQSDPMDRFADDFTGTGSPDRSIDFNGKSAPIATVKAWKRPDGSWVLHSSLNPGAYFAMTDSLMDRELWPEPSKWIWTPHPAASPKSAHPASSAKRR